MSAHVSSTGTPPPLQQTGPDTGIRSSKHTSTILRTATLDQARKMLGDELAYQMCFPMDYLWQSFELKGSVLTEVKQHLTKTGCLSKDGGWGIIGRTKIEENQFTRWKRGKSEAKTFAFLSRLFNTILGQLGPQAVEEMTDAGSITPKSTIISTNRPDAYLHMAPKTLSITGEPYWRVLSCPFEFKFGTGDTRDVSRPMLPQDHILTFYRMILRSCKVSTTSCAQTPVEISPLESLSVELYSTYGSCAEQHSSHLTLLTGSRLVQLHTLGAGVFNIPLRNLNHLSNSSSYLQPPPRRILGLRQVSRAVVTLILISNSPFKAQNIVLQDYSMTLVLMQQLVGGHGHLR